MFDNGFRIQAGPQVKVSSSKSDSDNDYNPLDFALSVGGSYVVPSTGFGIDLRYNHGLSDVYESNDLKGTNRGFSLACFTRSAIPREGLSEIFSRQVEFNFPAVYSSDKISINRKVP
ncbi:MAG: hypothetical protein MZV63_07540 [Marinilabiliales bacterium]|nr:hypothetical protein [Marinilabiliales bacterium]